MNQLKNINETNALFNDYPDLLSIGELQEALGVGRSTAYRLINDERIKHLRIGKSIKIPKIYILDFVLNSCYHDVG